MTQCINNQQETNSREGAILMELVISVALFVVMIGGTMWLGDIILAKCKLVSSDRYAAWNAGNRHMLAKGRIVADIQDNLFPFDRVGDQRVEDIEYERGDPALWSTYFGARVDFFMVMPIWTEGWLAAGVTWEDAPGLARFAAFTGRDPDAADGPSHHAVRMRTRFSEIAYRTWTPQELADWSMPWDWAVYDEEWPEVDDLTGTSEGELTFAPSPPSPPPGIDHERHEPYVEWSY